ncbi:hypothetical protein GJ631_10610 [Natronomonas sp. CBA1123]|uniref:hypothetical protein n=1 Tax=Natronomonas sp. CBA1123 TaxID=2668070 RepID=UPI0012EA6E20|nr:hypothetical protein [Natronomonas sp. CBA1123]MUV87005.1 hypothetical protein [Natronomonas sp. CBA1123]
MPLRCLACQTDFECFEDYERHRWNEHGGDCDLGDAATNPTQLTSLVSDEDCLEPPILEG